MNDQINTTRDLLNNFWDEVVSWVPEFIGAVVIMLVGYIVAKILVSAVRQGLASAQFDQRLYASQGGQLIKRAMPSPTSVVTWITFWGVMFGALSLAVAVLGSPALVDLVRAIYGYIPNVIAAILIFLVASAISAGTVALVRNTMGDTPTGKLLATVTPIVVMGIATFMILNQLMIAPAIVTITYTALVGGAALGGALAFGLGGRDVAARLLEDAYVKGQTAKEQVKRDVRQGTAVARRKAASRSRR